MIALGVAAAFALPPQWSAWKRSAPVARSAAAIQSITVPPAVLSNAQGDLRDVRIVDSRGNEIPYTIVVRNGSRSAQWQEARLDDYGFVPRQYTQVGADAGAPQEDYTALDISTPRTNFATTVDVFASDDRHRWRIVRQDAPIFDYQADGLGSNTRITISPSHSRYYRIFVREARAAFPIDAVRFAQGVATLPELSRYPGIGVTHSRQGNNTLLMVDARYAHLPVSFIRIDTSTPRFLRTATLEASDDAVNWNEVDTQTLERTPFGERRSWSFDEAQARYWRIRILNGNDAPLWGVRVELWGTPRHVVFAAAPSQSYRFLYENPGAPAPVYDFAATHRPSAIDAAAAVGLGRPSKNAAYTGPARPWSESHQWVLSTALAAAVVGVGALAVRTLAAEGPSVPRGPSIPQDDKG